MENPKKKCIHCGRWFLPDARVGNRQKRCFRQECLRALNRKKQKKWIELNPCYLAARCAKVRAWAKAYPNYWQKYRRNHPSYVEEDNCRRAESLRKQRRSAKLTSMRVLSVERLRQIQDLAPRDCSAKLTEIDRRVDGIVEYLFWTVKEPCSAKQTHIDLGSGPAVG